MDNSFLKHKIQNNIFYLLRSISGYYVYQLIDNIDLFLTKKKILDKGLLGRLIEKYIINKIFKGKICDILFLNLELKTIFFNIQGFPIYDVLFMSFKLLDFFKKKIKDIFFLKIKKILWVPILGKKNTFFLYKYIGDFFLTVLTKYSINILWNELIYIINFIFTNLNLVTNNYYYTNNFKLQFIFVKQNDIKNNFFDTFYIRLYLRNFFLKNILFNNKILN